MKAKNLENNMTDDQTTEKAAGHQVMIIAGEISGDMHAAALIRAIRASKPDTAFFGIGGDLMRSEGVEIFYDVKDMAVMGFTEVMKRFGFFRRVFHHMLSLAETRKPDAVILVDYPGFNLRFAEKVHKMGIKTIYYICPQVWAWNRGRIPKMARIVDRLISIFPFEAKHFEKTGLKVDFVGHPLVDEIKPFLSGPTPELPWNDGKPRVAILPGSRRHEIERILPVMMETVILVEKKYPNSGFIIAAPSQEIAGFIKERVARFPVKPDRLEIVGSNTRQVLRQATAAMVASGTATVETALIQCPMVIIYKMSALTYLFARMLVRVKSIGMVNIIADRQLCPEFIQHKAVPANIARAMISLLGDTPDRGFQLKNLEKVSEALGPGGAADRAAEIVIEELSS